MNLEVERLLDLAAQVPMDRRREFLAQECPDPLVRAEVESLLAYSDGSETYFYEAVRDVAMSLRASLEASRGDAIGAYRIISPIGRGGMGSVYLAERADGEIQQKVAVKLLRADGNRAVWRERFLKERQLLASLHHPSIVRVIDAGHTEDGRPYLVMEYVDGIAIDKYASTLDLRSVISLFLLVCDGVSHAHRHLIVHRDLKPSNILVDSSGRPKLLDFGIAKLLDTETDETRTVERLLTPHYASPEQLRGDLQSTATDVYSLGAVLYKLLAGRSPNEPASEIQHAGRVDRPHAKLPRDLDYVLRKALRAEPDERYSSVDAFADDLRAFLDFRPVLARSGNAWYHTRKFLQRHWVTASASAVTVAGLALGLYIADRERFLAQQRFQQVRQLANRVLSLDAAVGALSGSTKARHEIVAMSKEYLESLAPRPGEDRDLALEIGVAYELLARAQGVPGGQNLGQYAQAEESLQKARALIEPVLAASPRNRQALLAISGINQGLMTLARQTGRRNDESLAYARSAAHHLDAFLALGEPSQQEAREAARQLYSIALSYRNMHLHEDAMRFARRSTEITRSLPPDEGTLADGLSLLADLKRISGDLDGALTAIREARTILQATDYTSEPQRRTSWFLVLWREGVILGGGNGLNLNRPDEAAAVLQQAFDVIEERAQSDPNDASIRIYFDQTARELGAILRDRDAPRAQRMYDHALRRLAEVKDNPRARQGEAGLLAGSSYAWRRIGHASEAKKRIDAAFRLLRETKDYPADKIDTDSEVEPALRALGDHYAETGQPLRAAEVYQELLDKIMAAQPDSENDLRRATKLSRIYETLAGLYKRNRQSDRAAAVSSLRRNLWLQWNRKLPNNAYVRRHLQAAGD